MIRVNGLVLKMHKFLSLQVLFIFTYKDFTSTKEASNDHFSKLLNGHCFYLDMEMIQIKKDDRFLVKKMNSFFLVIFKNSHLSFLTKRKTQIFFTLWEVFSKQFSKIVF